MHQPFYTAESFCKEQNLATPELVNWLVVNTRQFLSCDYDVARNHEPNDHNCFIPTAYSASVAEWYAVACLVTSSSPVLLKTRRVGQRCTLNLSRAESSSRWCGVVVRGGGASSGVILVT
ncbi:UNVERIFIED_CONTAM: hypothetical protein NCL1_34831 [Trichonephila clavipes]